MSTPFLSFKRRFVGCGATGVCGCAAAYRYRLITGKYPDKAMVDRLDDAIAAYLLTPRFKKEILILLEYLSVLPERLHNDMFYAFAGHLAQVIVDDLIAATTPATQETPETQETPA